MKAATQAWVCQSSRLGERIARWIATHSSRSTEVLGEEDALALNDKEVDELVDVANHAIEGRSRDGVVAAGTHLRGQSVAENELTGSLGADGDGERHPRQLERPADDIEVSGGEDEGDDGGVGNSRGTLRDTRVSAGLGQDGTRSRARGAEGAV